MKKYIDKYKDDMINDLVELIKIKSVEEEKVDNMPFGNGPAKALDKALELCKEKGFKIKNIDNYAGHADLGEQDETLGILCHLDVVPEGEGWNHGPYSGAVEDGKIFGRGTIDDKGPAVAAMYAMKIVDDMGVKLNKKVRIIFGTNEETGSKGIEYYLTKEKEPDMAFTPDADFPVIHGEMGILIFDLKKKLEDMEDDNFKILDIKGGNAPNMVPDGAYAILKLKNDNILNNIQTLISKNDNLSMENKNGEIKIIAKGISAHGSTPKKGVNAITILLDVLNEIISNDNDINKFIRFYKETINEEVNGKSIGCGLKDDISGELVFNVGMINIENEDINLKVNIRYPVTKDDKQVFDGMRKVISNYGIELVEDEHAKPLYMEKDHELVTKLMDVYRDVTKDEESQPIVIGGGTYARTMKNAVAFGPLFPGEKDTMHQKNEYISIESLQRMTEIYAKAIISLCE